MLASNRSMNAASSTTASASQRRGSAGPTAAEAGCDSKVVLI
jgi:hypothetical protein